MSFGQLCFFSAIFFYSGGFMQYNQKRNIRNIIIVAFLLLTALLCKEIAYSTQHYLTAALLILLRNVIHISIVAVWTVSIYMRVINRQIRNLLIAVGLLMLCWLVVKNCKWEFLYATDALTRYLWYAYYIPMIIIPLLGVFITKHIGKSDAYSIDKKNMLLYIPAFVLIAIVFTNDFHRLVFDFPDGLQYFNKSYSYEIFFYVVSIWFVGLGFYFVLKILIKSRVPGSRSFQKVHILIMGGAVIFWVFYAFAGLEADLTAVDCTLITLLLESAIQSGLIRTNTNYAKLFEISGVAAQITDKHLNPCIMSSDANQFDKNILHSALESQQNLGDFILNGTPVSGGYVFWQDDIKDINDLIETLQDTQKQLSENIYLLQAELELKEQQVKTAEKTRLFNRLIAEISPKIDTVRTILSLAQSDAGKRNEQLSLLCFIGAYIKRRGNLFLLAEDHAFVRACELQFCIHESLDNLRLLCSDTALQFELDGEMAAADAVRLYDIFQYITEPLVLKMNAVFVKVFTNKEAITMRILLDVRDAAAIGFSDALFADTHTVSEYSDNDLLVEVTLMKGGTKI